MRSKAIRISTILLFSALIALFVAYKSGYFAPKEPVAITVEPLSEQLLQNAMDTVIKIDDLVVDKALFELAASSKSMAGADQSFLAQSLQKALSKEEMASARQLNSIPASQEYDVTNLQDVMISSTKVIIPNDKTILARRMKTTFTKDWRRIFDMILTSNDSVEFKKDERLDNPPDIPLWNETYHPEWTLYNPPQTPADGYIRDNLASTSKSIVIVDRKPLADSLKRLILLKNFKKKFDTLKKNNNPR